MLNLKGCIVIKMKDIPYHGVTCITGM